jgi:hypothetical protein
MKNLQHENWHLRNNERILQIQLRRKADELALLTEQYNVLMNSFLKMGAAVAELQKQIRLGE